MATNSTDAQNAFIPRPAATRGQALVGAFCMLLLAGVLIASATVTLACAGMSACHSGASIEQTQASLPFNGLRG